MRSPPSIKERVARVQKGAAEKAVVVEMLKRVEKQRVLHLPCISNLWRGESQRQCAVGAASLMRRRDLFWTSDTRCRAAGFWTSAFCSDGACCVVF